MADRLDFYFRQRVTEAELDLAFELLEKADRNFASDLGIYGVISGGELAQHTPVADTTVDLTSPTRAYDRLGQRIFFGTNQRVECAVDFVGLPTDVSSSGNERWLGVFLRFKRQLSDPRTDGNSQQVFFRRDESFELLVRQAPEGPAGSAPRVELQPDELLLGEIRRRPGQSQIVSADIDTSRRQVFIFAQGTSVAVEAGTWNILQPIVGTVQASFDEVDAELDAHFGATGRRHTSKAIDHTPHGFVTKTTIGEALDESVDKLSADTGAGLVGAPAVAGTPLALPPGKVAAQLSVLLGGINDHISKSAGAHNASAIAATPHGFVTGTSTQAQLIEIIDELPRKSAAETIPGDWVFDTSVSAKAYKLHLWPNVTLLAPGFGIPSESASPQWVFDAVNLVWRQEDVSTDPVLTFELTNVPHGATIKRLWAFRQPKSGVGRTAPPSVVPKVVLAKQVVGIMTPMATVEVLAASNDTFANVTAYNNSRASIISGLDVVVNKSLERARYIVSVFGESGTNAFAGLLVGGVAVECVIPELTPQV